jgi:TRAP-type C4-dicarboxylate transport system permease small subunit
MYRWPWLERTLRRHPAVGLVPALALLTLSVVILVTAPTDRSPRTGLPMWLLAGFLAVMMAVVAFRFVLVLVRGRREEP